MIDLPGPDEPFDVNVDDESFAKLAQWRRRFGPLYTIRPRRRKHPSVVVNDPDILRQVLIGNHRNYRKGVGFERVKMLLGNGIIVSDGEFWRSQRRMMQPLFHKRVIESMAVMMLDCSRRQLRCWQAAAERGESVDLTRDMVEMSLDVILRSLFGDDIERLSEEEGSNPFALLSEDPTRDLQMAMRFRQLRRHVEQIMTWRRQEQRDDSDFLSLMLSARDKDTGATMADAAIVDEVMTIIVAGHETTAGTLNWVWYLLSQHPAARDRVIEEACRLPAEPCLTDLPALPFIRQVIEETLRLYPPVWLFSRQAIDEDDFGGVHIPANSNIFLCPWQMHRDERFWERPDDFMPGRFSDDVARERNRHVFYPFSLGSRRCIGEYFSMVDMQLHVAQVARSLFLEHVPDRPVEIEPHVNLRSRHSIRMQPRRHDKVCAAGDSFASR